MNTTHCNKIKNLFLRESYQDSWEDYTRSLQKSNFIRWDYIILTASNEEQAKAFRVQIRYRVEKGLLPAGTKYMVLPDPDGKRVGSGGATFNVLRYISMQEERENPFEGKRILVIHSGGDSKRIPQYSAVGKLFSPVPRELPDGRASTLFDEFVIAMSGVPSRIPEGMLVLSGDVLLLFNPLQIDSQFHGAAAISVKEPVETGKNHGVFLNDGNGYVKNFLHKQTEETLRESGAVNKQGAVDLDTGAILLDAELLQALNSLISTDGGPDDEKFAAFVNERARVSFYGDMLYPLASASTLEQYYREKPEGENTKELRECRTQLWKVLRNFSLKLLCPSPAQFIHFGTTAELSRLMSDEISDYEFLGWKKNVATALPKETDNWSSYSTYVGHQAKIEKSVYLENSYILDNSRIGEGSVVSHVHLRNSVVPPHVVLHGLPLRDGRYVVRIYGVEDNPKGGTEAEFLGTTMRRVLENAHASAEQFWEKDKAQDIWNAKIFPVCETLDEATDRALELWEYVSGKENDWDNYFSQERISLCDSFNAADVQQILEWEQELECRILCRKFIDRIAAGEEYKDALTVFGQRGITDEIYHTLMEDAETLELGLKIRIYYAISGYMKHNGGSFDGKKYDYAEDLCFGTIQDTIYCSVTSRLPDSSDYHIVKDRVDVKLPVRVNWGGGWTDTPPYCMEKGGVVLNAAISLNGILPVQITVKKLEEYNVEFESQDVGVYGTVTKLEELQDCHNPYDPFALHKAALIACGLIPLKGGKEPLDDILHRIGGGIYLSTSVVGVPKGSGLGTSSILAGACIRGLFEFFGQECSDEEIYSVVLSMEQIMSTGGGWQDQVGGLTNGVKLIRTNPGVKQTLQVEHVKMSEATKKELQERFALIYTGQRRLARNLLRNVVGGYIGSRPESVTALKEMKPKAAMMKFYLEQGDIDSFAEELNRHWELSCMLDSGTTNTCIDHIFASCGDLIDGKFISGAGGGGFLMVILKKGVTKEMLHERLEEIFQDSGVDVWETEFV
jgi:fucokinase